MGEIKGIMNVNVGIDIGSTTVKIVVVRDGEIIHKHYERHFSKVREKAVELVRAARELIGTDTPLRCSITGSAGLGVAKAADIDFVQEVFATRKAVGVHVPQADVVIELGGEDAKIIYFDSESFGHLKDLSCSGIGHCNPAILLWFLNLMDRTLYCLKNPYHKLHSFQSLASV